MRKILISLLLVTCGSAAAQNFSGAWVGWQCPAGLAPESDKCASFVLELHQKSGRICGSHLFSTAAAQTIDGGDLPSIRGQVAEGLASVTVESGGKGQASAELRLNKGKLIWKRLENPGGAYLLPQAITLVRSMHGSLFHASVQQQLSSVCAGVLSAPVNSAPANSGP